MPFEPNYLCCEIVQNELNFRANGTKNRYAKNYSPSLYLWSCLMKLGDFPLLAYALLYCPGRQTSRSMVEVVGNVVFVQCVLCYNKVIAVIHRKWPVISKEKGIKKEF